jgi:hypothetical protein
MPLVRRGTAFGRFGCVSACLGLLGMAASLTGCATSPASDATGPRPLAARAALEDDGLPVQAAPPASIRHGADDPREPFSRSYGSGPARLSGPPVRMTRAEEDAIIARAIAEHEMRRP